MKPVARFFLAIQTNKINVSLAFWDPSFNKVVVGGVQNWSQSVIPNDQRWPQMTTNGFLEVGNKFDF